MSESHHYIPVFYLKKWTGDDLRLCQYSRPYDRVKAIRKHPSATGFAENLYAIPGADAETERRLERRFFLVADDGAAQALKIIESGPGAQLDDRLRTAWSRFLMTLLFRTPEAVSRWKSNAEQAAAQAHAAALRSGNPPSNPLDYYSAKGAVAALEGLMDNKVIGRDLNLMTWQVVPLQSTHSLLTSDRPLWMESGMAEPDFLLRMPIGPRRLFIAATDPALAQRLARQDHDELAALMNDRVASQAQEFVWGIDDSRLPFVEERLGQKVPMSPVDPIVA
jgi:hypothetical protein